MEDLRTTIEVKQLQMHVIKQELTNTTTELNEINEKITTYAQEKTSMQKNIATKRIALTAIKNQHNTIRSRVQAQDSIVQNLHRKMDQLIVHDTKLFGNVQHLKDKLNIKSQEMQKNQESIDQISKEIGSIQDQQKQSNQIIIDSKKELVSTEQELDTIDQEIVKMEQKYLHRSTETFIGNEQTKTNIME